MIAGDDLDKIEVDPTTEGSIHNVQNNPICTDWTGYKRKALKDSSRISAKNCQFVKNQADHFICMETDGSHEFCNWNGHDEIFNTDWHLVVPEPLEKLTTFEIFKRQKLIPPIGYLESRPRYVRLIVIYFVNIITLSLNLYLVSRYENPYLCKIYVGIIIALSVILTFVIRWNNKNLRFMKEWYTKHEFNKYRKYEYWVKYIMIGPFVIVLSFNLIGLIFLKVLTNQCG